MSKNKITWLHIKSSFLNLTFFFRPIVARKATDLSVSMYNNSRMAGAMFLMLKKSADRRQQEALENAFKVRTESTIIEPPKYLLNL